MVQVGQRSVAVRLDDCGCVVSVPMAMRMLMIVLYVLWCDARTAGAQVRDVHLEPGIVLVTLLPV